MKLFDPPPRELTDWLQANAVALKTVEAGNGFDDLKPVGEMIGDARVVTVCEASHGIRDIFQLKHRIFEYLVGELGFTTFVVTASYADSFSLWDYVRGGPQVPSMALSEMRWWTLDNEELLDLVRWMRAFNDARQDGRKLSFFGCDVNAPCSAVHRVIEYLETVDPRKAGDFASRLAPIATDLGAGKFHLLDGEQKREAELAIEDLSALFLSESDGRARLAAHTLRQRLESLRDPGRAWQVKDRSCAENIARILELEGSDSKVMVWTHNGHGQRTPFMDGVTSMGETLDAMFGEDHVIIGTAFGEGSLQAIDPETGILQSFDLPLAPEGTLDRTFAGVKDPIYAVDLRKMSPEGPEAQWFSQRPGSRFTGSDFSDDPSVLGTIYRSAYGLESEYAPTDPRALFDIMVFIRSVESARSNWPVSPPGPTADINDSPENLDFGLVDDRGFPEGWTFQSPRIPGRHEIEAKDGGIRIARSEIPWRWGDGVVSQRINAKEYAARTVRFSAHVEPETAGVGNTAQLLVQADNEKGPIAATLVPAQGNGTVIEFDVPADATILEFALVLSGDGSAVFSNVRLSINP